MPSSTSRSRVSRQAPTTRAEGDAARRRRERRQRLASAGSAERPARATKAAIPPAAAGAITPPLPPSLSPSTVASTTAGGTGGLACEASLGALLGRPGGAWASSGSGADSLRCPVASVGAHPGAVEEDVGQ